MPAGQRDEGLTKSFSQRTELAGRMHDVALGILRQALSEAGIDRAFDRNVACERGVLRVCDDLYDLNAYPRVLVISLGKAAHTMIAALQNQTGERFEGIIDGPASQAHQLRGFEYFHGGHPLPDQESIHAARATLRALDSLHPESLVIYLLSGGGSSMMEQFLDDELTAEDLVSTYDALVHSGAPIFEINAIRKHLSAVKGGRLAQHACPAHQVSLLVSDVPENTPDALASGPTMPDSTSANDCYAIAAKYGLKEKFPTRVRGLFESHALDETPKSGDPAFHRSRWWTILSNATLLEAAKQKAASQAFHVEIDNSCDDLDYLESAQYLLQRIRKLKEKFGKSCLISGGEVTVKVSQAGVGGRNQHFALACALNISGENITVLSAGTDGVDGNSPSAGAIADGTTLERGKNSGVDGEASLNSFNSYEFFRKAGGEIVTGPTGNNLRDLRILLAY